MPSTDSAPRSPTGPRIAILGLHLEANGFAPPTTRADFLAECWEEGDAISEMAARPSHLPLEIPGFYDRMNATGPWTPVPSVTYSRTRRLTRSSARCAGRLPGAASSPLPSPPVSFSRCSAHRKRSPPVSPNY